MPKFSQLLKSKTLWASLTAIVTGTGAFFAGDGNVEGLLLAVFGLVSFVFRFYTTNDLTDK